MTKSMFVANGMNLLIDKKKVPEKGLPFNDCLRAVVNYKEKMIPTWKLFLTKLCYCYSYHWYKTVMDQCFDTDLDQGRDIEG